MNQQDKQLLEILSIDFNAFEEDFGKATINRGIAYYKSKKATVAETFEQGNTIRIIGVVSGSGRNQYETTLEIQPDLFGITVASTCSCPVYLDCKHGVALLFSFLQMVDSQQDTDDEEVDDWLDYIDQNEQKDSLQHHSINQPISIPDKAKNQYHVIYLLNLTIPKYEDDDEGLYIQVCKARLLKKGGYGKEYRLSSYSDISSFNQYYGRNLYFEPIDEDIVNILKSVEKTDGYYSYELKNDFYPKGEIAEIILKKLLKTKRAFWKTQKSPPLLAGEHRELQLDWKDQGEHLTLEVITQPRIDSIFKLEHIHYVDAANATLGLLTHQSLSDQQIRYFLAAPPIPKERAKEASERLSQMMPETEVPLPAPIHFETIEIKGVKPTFQLKLHAVPVPAIGTETSRLIHLASLSFDYGEVVYHTNYPHDLDKPISIMLEGKTRYKIHRDNALEKQAIERLYQQGFDSMDITQSPYGVMDMAMYGSQTVAESIIKWDNFRQNELPLLEQEGWQITLDDSFSLEVEVIEDWHAELEESEKGDWFEMTLGFELDGKPINMLPLIIGLLANSPSTEALHQSLKEKEYELLQMADYQWVKIPTKRILLILDTVVELYDTGSLNEDGNLEFSKHAALHYGDLLNDPQLKWKGADELKALNNKLQDFAGIESVSTPQGLQAELREYQKEGFNWLQFLQNYQLNGVLADDMGLGKTVQALTNLLKEKEAGRASQPSLVIAPTSLMSNWRREAEKFTPGLKVLTLQGPDRKKKFPDILDYDIVLTTYPLMIRDTEFYEAQNFHYLILDEAQAIKNAKSKTTQIIYGLKSNHRLCLTGTPIENHLGELWSMFHFLMPGYLGTQQRFAHLFRTPIEKHGDNKRGVQLRKRVQPFMLRRTKDLVAKDLPEKTEIVRSVPLTGKQRDLYETVRLAMDKKVRDEISKKGLARSHIMILDALLKLRQVCCDPRLVKLAKAKKVKQSAKLELLMDMIPEMIEEGRKILLFSQFTTMLSIIEEELNKHKISYSKLTGQTRKREEAINAFQEGKASVFLISLKAGGVGLNLTAADTVIHYDPWWNPAVERQATDRAYRIGQDKPVFVYKLLTEETVEEKILALQEKKQQLADAVYGGKGKKDLAFGQNELMDLLKPLE